MTAWLRKGYVMPVPETAVKCTMYVYAVPVQSGGMNFIGMQCTLCGLQRELMS
mgnify:CR=1 FL=1